MRGEYDFKAAWRNIPGPARFDPKVRAELRRLSNKLADAYDQVDSLKQAISAHKIVTGASGEKPREQDALLWGYLSETRPID